MGSRAGSRRRAESIRPDHGRAAPVRGVPLAHRWSLPVRACAAGAGILVLGGIVLTLSRGAFLTIGILAAAMVMFRWIRLAPVLACAVLLLLAAPLVAPRSIDRLTSILDARHLLSGDPATIQEADGAIRGRTTEMLSALYTFRDHPVIGVGPAQFPPFYFQQYSKVADIKFKDIEGPRRAHTLYLEMAAEEGVVGLAVFLSIAGALMRQLWNARHYWDGKDPESSDLATALFLSLAAYFCTALFLHLSYQRYYWFLVAIAAAAVHVLRARAGATESRVEPAAIGRRWYTNTGAPATARQARGS